MAEVGEAIDKLPEPRRAASSNDWDCYALLARLRKGKFIKAASNIRISAIKSVRQYDRPPFVTPEGRIQVHMRDSYIGEDNIRYGDVYFSWAPGKSS